MRDWGQRGWQIASFWTPHRFTPIMFFILIISERRMKINAFSIYMFSPRLMLSMHSWIKQPFYEIISQCVFSGARIPPHNKIISKKHCQSVLVYSNKMLDGYLVLQYLGHNKGLLLSLCSRCRRPFDKWKSAELWQTARMNRSANTIRVGRSRACLLQ